jgi:predicted nucleic acid-binding protein
MSVLVDSDILIEVSRGQDKIIVARWLDLSESAETVLYCPVTAAELWTGALPHEHKLLARLFQSLLCASVDYETGRLAGSFLQRYRKSHQLELGDALIASTAVQHHAALWTRNRKHYPMKELSFF